MYKIIRWFTAMLLVNVVSTVSALTYQPMLDEDLLEQSPVVVRGHVLSRDDLSSRALGLTSYQLGVDEIYKGQVPSGEITVLVPGNSYSGAHQVPGAPQFIEAAQVVLFLSPTDAGAYRLVHLPLGAFFASRDLTGESVYSRQLSASNALALPVPNRSAVREAPRQAASFLNWLGDSAPEHAASTVNPLSATGGRTEQDEFTTLNSPGSPPSRWWDFDSGASVSFRAHNSGQAGMTGGGFAQFQTGISAWNNDAGSMINYSYGGTTSASGGLEVADGVNTILFNDPNNEVDGTFTCSAGGVLAIGGFVTSGNTRTFASQLFGEIIEGDIVTNNGAGCFFAMQGNSNGEEVFAHELGHSLGLGHSCEETGGLPLVGPVLDPSSCQVATAAELDALMKATPHGDGRGADLRSDDQAGAAFLYPDQGGSTTPDPDPPSGGTGEPAPTPAPVSSSSGGGGGCAIASTQAHSMDLSILLLLALSILCLSYRRQTLGRLLNK